MAGRVEAGTRPLFVAVLLMRFLNGKVSDDVAKIIVAVLLMRFHGTDYTVDLQNGTSCRSPYEIQIKSPVLKQQT